MVGMVRKAAKGPRCYRENKSVVGRTMLPVAGFDLAFPL